MGGSPLKRLCSPSPWPRHVTIGADEGLRRVFVRCHRVSLFASATSGKDLKDLERTSDGSTDGVCAVLHSV